MFTYYADNFRITLASSSPRRKMLLEQAGVEFDIKTVDIDEAFDESIIRRQGLDTAIEDLAMRKADASRRGLDEQDKKRRLLIAADTIVCLGERIFGKPVDEGAAFLMLKSIAGRAHMVKTGVCLMEAGSGKFLCGTETTLVHIAALSDDEIRDYIATGEPMDKAGAYAAQGLGARFVRRIEGCYYNVVGLPLGLTFDLIRDITLLQ